MSTYNVTAARTRYTKELKQEIAELVISGRARSVELSKRRNIPVGNIDRWVRQARAFRISSQTAELISSNKTELTVFKPPGKGQRYSQEQKAAVLQVFTTGKLSIAEIAKRTRVHQSTIYAWIKEAADRDSSEKVVQQVEVLQEDNRRNNMQAAIHLRKAKAELLTGIRRGLIDDFDNVHLNCLLALNALNGR